MKPWSLPTKHRPNYSTSTAPPPGAPLPAPEGRFSPEPGLGRSGRARAPFPDTAAPPTSGPPPVILPPPSAATATVGQPAGARGRRAGGAGGGRGAAVPGTGAREGRGRARSAGRGRAGPGRAGPGNGRPGPRADVGERVLKRRGAAGGERGWWWRGMTRPSA